jgi:hypothetical protein
MTTIRTNASRRPRIAQSTRPNIQQYGRNPSKGTEKMISGLQLIHEALSRARMPRPQDKTSEAYRSARQIAMRARREQTRLLGDRL